MGYSEDREKKIQRDIAMGTTHTIEGAMHKKGEDMKKFQPKQSPLYIPPVAPAPYLGSKPQSFPIVGSSSQDVPSSPSWVSEFIDKHYPKKAPLWAYFVTAIIGCLLGAAIGNASGGAVSGAVLGAILGFFCIPIVVIGFHLALRILAVAIVILIGYFILTHLGR